MGSGADYLATSLYVVGEWQSSAIKTKFSKTEDSSRSSDWNDKRLIEPAFPCLRLDLKISS